MKIKNLKEISKLFVALLAIVSGVVLVNADTRATGVGVSLAKNDTATITMDDCTYPYYFGSAIASVQPSSNAYFTWTMKTKGWFSTTKATDVINNLSTSKYSSTQAYSVANGSYNFVFKIYNNSFQGSVQTTNATTVIFP